MLAGNAAYDPAATWLIQRITATGGETSITFSSIPQTYLSLQIRGVARDTAGGGQGGIALRFNGVSTTSYSNHALQGDGASATASGSASATYVVNGNFGMPNSTALASTFGANIIDIHDYASTTKNKTVRLFAGCDLNGTGIVGMRSGGYFATTAVTSLTIYPASTAFAAGSTFALYGMK